MLSSLLSSTFKILYDESPAWSQKHVSESSSSLSLNVTEINPPLLRVDSGVTLSARVANAPAYVSDEAVTMPHIWMLPLCVRILGYCRQWPGPEPSTFLPFEKSSPLQISTQRQAT